MRCLFIFLVFPFAAFATEPEHQEQCDIEAHTGRDEACWDTFDTLQDMGDIGHHLVHNATCEEITEAVQTVGAGQSPRQLMLNISFVTYANGYADGVSKPVDFILVEMLTFCAAKPTAKLNEF